MGDEEKDKTPKMSSRDQEDVDKYKKHLEDDGKGYENGPIENRTCSDIFMCILFLVFIVGMFGAASYGFKNGDPRKLIIGWDSDANGCGYGGELGDSPTAEFPYLYWAKAPSPEIIAEITDIVKNDPKNVKAAMKKAINLLNDGVCVKECPSAEKTEAVNCYETEGMKKLPKYYTTKDKKGKDKKILSTNYFENCVYYMDTMAMTKLIPDSPELEGISLGGTTRIPFRYDTKL